MRRKKEHLGASVAAAAAVVVADVIVAAVVVAAAVVAAVAAAAAVVIQFHPTFVGSLMRKGQLIIKKGLELFSSEMNQLPNSFFGHRRELSK